MKSFDGKPNCCFTHSKVIDLIFVINRIFSSNDCPGQLKDIYSEDFIQELRDNYRFLGEIIPTLFFKGSEVIEFMLLGDHFNDIAAFEKLVYSLEDADFFYNFFGQHIDKTAITSALAEEKGFSALYREYSESCTSYLALKSLFDNRALFMQQLFACMRQLDTTAFQNEYVQAMTRVYDEYDRIEQGLAGWEPLELSQRIMGKIFNNRGPYERFTFVPSCFIDRKAIRFFGRHQILIYSLNNKHAASSDIIKVLKTISDEKRFEIIELLSKNKTMMGKDLAERVNLSKATISHHIEQLKEIGFVNEERVKNSKYYSVNNNAVDKFIGYITTKLKNQ